MTDPGQKTAGILLYPGFELLDTFGPAEMFISVPPEMLRVVMVAEHAGEVTSGSVASSQCPRVVADYGFDDAPKLDILLVPGGVGTFEQLENETLLNWLAERSKEAEIVSSVCTGSVLLARAGILDGKKATTNKQFWDLSTSQAPDVNWIPKARWVEDGNVMTSSGVSAGIDMSLALIARVFGKDLADQIAAGTEYVWGNDPDNDPFAHLVA